MSGASKKLMQAAGAGAGVEADEFFNQTTLLLHGDGTNGAQNNTFLDGSTNNFTITRNGNTTQGSFSPYGDRWSNYFDGNQDYLTAPDNPAFNFGSGDFTIEGWVYNELVAVRGVFQISNTGLSTSFQDTIGLAYNTNRWEIYTGSGQAFSSFSTPPIFNAWQHFAYVRNGSTITLYIDGVSVITKSDSTDYGFQKLVIGGIYDNSYVLKGYISDFRVVKGTALYTSNFTPPTEPLTAISGTSLLTCQSNRFKDNSANNFAITRNGDVKVTTFSPYAPTDVYDPAVDGGSGYFGGFNSGSWLKLDGNSQLSFNGDFTWELWAYPVDTDKGNFFSTSAPILDAQWFRWEYDNASISATNNVGGFSLNGSPGAYPPNQWYHLAITRAGGTARLFVNGVVADAQASAATVGTTDYDFLIGVEGGDNYLYDDRIFYGYLADVRIVKGTALYTTNFTPPTAPLTAVTNTSLLCNFTNAGIFDSTAKNVLETVGNAQIDTAVVKYGTGSMEFDGTGDYLVMPLSENLQLGTGDFTVEFWMNSSTTPSGYPVIVGNITTTSGTWRIGNAFNGTNEVLWTWYTTGYNDLRIAFNVNDGNWHHVAAVRSSGTLTVYIDGISRGSTTVTTDLSSSIPVRVASEIPNSVFYTGYIDELRITKGVARYTANFTPPTRAFPDQ